jgi:hypothetical protein
MNRPFLDEAPECRDLKAAIPSVIYADAHQPDKAACTAIHKP